MWWHEKDKPTLLPGSYWIEMHIKLYHSVKTYNYFVKINVPHNYYGLNIQTPLPCLLPKDLLLKIFMHATK